MSFKDVPVGATFRFAFSSGWYTKISARRYVLASTYNQPKAWVYRVGSIHAEIAEVKHVDPDKG